MAQRAINRRYRCMEIILLSYIKNYNIQKPSHAKVKGKKKKQFTRLCSIPLPLRERGHTQGQYSTNEYCLTHNFSTERLQSQVMDTVFVLFLKFLLTFLARNNSSTHNTVSPVFFYRHLIVLPVKSPSIHYRRRPGKWMASRKTFPF